MTETLFEQAAQDVRQSPAELQTIETTSQIAQLLRQSRCLDALALGKRKLGDDLRQWSGASGQIAAATLALRLGGYQLNQALIYRARRSFPEDPQVIYFGMRQWLAYKPLARMWLAIRDQQLPTDDRLLLSRWLSLKGMILAGMRDFDRAFGLMDESIRQSPDDPLIRIQRAQAYADADDLREAIQGCRDAVEVAPSFGPAIQHLTQYLLKSNQIDEAFNLLTDAVKTTQDGQLRMQLAFMMAERERYEVAAKLIERIEVLFPLADPMRNGRPKPGSVYASIAALRSRLAYHAGDYPRTVQWASLANSAFHDCVAENVQTQHQTGRRALIKVPFVLQKHVTCAPATLTMLSRYWSIDVDHETVVNEICYDGTAPVKIRGWADANGMVTREFRVTYESAQALIDAGIPFGLATVEPGMGHIQVICGYDSVRGVLLIQDPGCWHVTEALASQIIDDYRAFGPRGLALVPKDQADRLNSIGLPDAQQFDQQYAIARALERHDRPAADSIVEEMRESDAGHWMTAWAEMDLASYDSNQPLQLAIIQKLRALFPDNDVLWLWENRLLTMSDRPDMVIERLREGIQQRRAVGSLRVQLIDMLNDDASTVERESLLRSLLRDMPFSSAGLSSESGRLWQQREYEDALELKRLAATSSELDEGYWQDFLGAATWMERQAEVLEILRQRFERHGDSSGGPGMTYAWALEVALQPAQAAEVVRQTIARRPNDAELLCQAAHVLGRLENPSVGLALLKSSKSLLPERGAWQAEAILASYDGRPADALAAYREIEKLQPLNPALSDQIASLQLELQGFDAAIDYLTELTVQFPHCRSLLASKAVMLKSAARFPEAVETIDRILVSNRFDGWAWRQRSLLGIRLSWYEQALQDSQQALECDKRAASHIIRGYVEIKLGRITKAEQYFRQAIEDDCDHIEAIDAWISICRDEEDRREMLTCVWKQLLLQRTDGAALAAYYDYACVTLSQEELRQQLSDFCKARPELFTAHVLLASHFANFRRFEEAENILTAIEDRFGCLPSYWQELGDLFARAEDADRSRTAYERGLAISPYDSNLALRLAQNYRTAKQSEEAVQLLKRALRGSPSDPSLMVALAETIDDKAESLALVRKAAMCAPSSSAAWELLLKMYQDLGQERKAVEAARELVASRPRDVHSHLRLAEMLHREDQSLESLKVIADALEQDPQQSDVHVLLATRLLRMGRYPEALAACESPDVDPKDRHRLDLVAARILYVSDRKDEACDRFRNALRRDPTNLDHWLELAEWCLETNHRRLFDEAASQLIQRAPHLAISHIHLAEKMIHEARYPLAIDHLRQAIAIDPKQVVAVERLMDIMLNSRNVNEAEKILDEFAAILPTQTLVIGRAFIASMTDDGEIFVETLEELPKGDPDISQLEIASAACQQINFENRPAIGLALSKAILKENANSAIGYAWSLFFCRDLSAKTAIATFHKIPASDARMAVAPRLWQMLENVFFTAPDHRSKNHAVRETLRTIKRLDQDLCQEASLWSGAIWTLIEMQQHPAAAVIAKLYASVRNRSVDELVAGMTAALYTQDLRLLSDLLADAKLMGPDKMTDYGRLMKAAYAVFEGSDQQLIEAIREVDRSKLQGTYLRLAKLINAGAVCVEAKDETQLVRQWKIDFFRPHADDDEIDQRIYYLLRSRVAQAAGNSKLAQRFKKAKYNRLGLDA